MSSHITRQKGKSLLGAPYRAVFYLWRRLPRGATTVFYTNPLAKAFKQKIRDTLARGAGREDLYSKEYYRFVDSEAARGAAAIAESVLAAFPDSDSLIDVGCGTGAQLMEFKTRGLRTFGLEYSEAALEVCRKRGLDVRCFDIESREPLNLGAFSLATCFEVAEHVAEEFANPLVDILTGLSKRIVFTAAVPGQGGGADHINEQPHEYWIAKFEERGYQHQVELSDEWRKSWPDRNVAGCYYKNIMVFVKPEAPAEVAAS